MGRHRLIAVAATAAALFAAAMAGIGAASTFASGSTAGSMTLTDASGDVHGPAADITTVVLSDDAVKGTITVAVTAVGYAAPVTDGMKLVKVYLDVDKNPSTGSLDQGGTEYQLSAGADPDGSGWWIQRWDGSGYVDVSQTPTMGFTRSGDVLTWTVNKSDIGVTTGFNFTVWSSTWDSAGNQTGEDNAPDDGMWTYDLSKPVTTTPTVPAVVMKPVIGAPVLSPPTAVAGRALSVSFPVTRSDTGAPLTTGKMICDPSVAGKVIPHAERFAAGVARLSFVIPKWAKGKTLKVHVTIKVGTSSATRVATVHVS